MTFLDFGVQLMNVLVINFDVMEVVWTDEEDAMDMMIVKMAATK